MPVPKLTPPDDRNAITPPQTLGGGVEPFGARSPYFSYDADTQMQPLPWETLGGGLQALGGGAMDFGKTILSLPGILGQGVKESLDAIGAFRDQLGSEPQKKKKKDVSDENIVLQYSKFGDTPEFWDAIGLEASQHHLTPTAKLPPIIGQLWDSISPERQAFIGQQQDVRKRLERMGPILNALAQAPTTPGGFERLGAPGIHPITEQTPYSPEAMPLGVPERLYGAQVLDAQAKQGAIVPTDQMQAAMTMAGGGTPEIMPQGFQPQFISPLVSSASQRGQNIVSPTEQATALKAMVVGGDISPQQYEAIVPTLTPMDKTTFGNVMRNLNATAGNSNTKTLNDLSLGLFGKTADQIQPDELVTTEDLSRVQQHGLTAPVQPGHMTRHTLLSSLKNVGIPKNIYEFQQGQQLQRQIAAAGPVAEASKRSTMQVTREAELAGGVNMLKTLTDLQGALFSDASVDTFTRNKRGFDIRIAVATNPDVGQWVQMADGLRPQLARIGGEIGNLAQAEQERAVDLIPDPFGKVIDRFPFWKGPDTKQVAKKKLVLLGEFLQTTLEAPKGADARSRVQITLRGVLKKLDEVDPPVTGAYSDAEKEARYQRWKKAHPGK